MSGLRFIDQAMGGDLNTACWHSFSNGRLFRSASLSLGVLLICLTGSSTGTAEELARVQQMLGAAQPWATPYYEIQAAEPGPTVMIVGGIHGNEPAGAAAAEQIRHWEISRGRLLIVPRANVAGLAKRTRYLPGAERAVRDLNRNFPTRDEPHPRTELATALWTLTEEIDPDWVLDLHEGYEFNISHEPPEGKKKSVGTSIIYQRNDAIDPLVKRMLATVNSTIADQDRRFVPLDGGPVQGSWVRACLSELNAHGMILETTYKDQALSLRARQHRILVQEVLQSLRMVDENQVDRLLDPAATSLAVGIFDGSGASRKGVRTMLALLTATEDLDATVIGPAECRAETLRQFDVLIFPGGSGSRQARALGSAGRQAVRTFVSQGGGYVGVCAGAYLCSAHYTWSLKIIDTAVFTGAREIEGVGRKQMWYRGGPTTVKMELTESGSELFAGIPREVEVRYQNGPIVSPQQDPLLPDYEVLAYFRSENGLYPPQEGTMVDTPAIVRARFGKGHVISISPHPEATVELASMLVTATRDVARERQASLSEQ